MIGISPAVDLHQRVVDLQTGERRHQMLDRRHRRASRIAEHCAQRRLPDVRPLRFDQPFASVRQPGAKEDDSRIDVGGMEDHASGTSRMNADPLDLDAIAQRRLETKFHISNFPQLRPRTPRHSARANTDASRGPWPLRRVSSSLGQRP